MRSQCCGLLLAGLVLAQALPLCAAEPGAPRRPAPPPAAAAAAGFSFALVGDAPYRAFEVPAFDALIDRINADPTIAFVLHVGDIKGSREPCSDALLAERLAQIGRLRVPVAFTPGDNEWTDCHSAGSGRRVPTERLQALRRLAWPEPGRTLGAPMAVATQAADPRFAEFVENQRFEYRGVLVVLLHVVGSRNGLQPWSGIDADDSRSRPRPDRIAEFEQRQAANLAWLDAAFERAVALDARALVVAMQANMNLGLGPHDADRVGYEPLIVRLRERAAAFGRPVLLAHGDGHVFFVDRPFAAVGAVPRVDNVLRVQTFGSPQVGWVRVRFDAQRGFSVAAE